MLNDLIEFKVVSNVHCVMLLDRIMDLLIVFLVLKKSMPPTSDTT